MPEVKRHPASTPLYHEDFCAWLDYQTILLRQGRLGEIDAEHIAEELDALSRKDRRELRNRLAELLLHLLKWRHQPELHGSSWEVSIAKQRIGIEDLLEDSPSLRPQLAAEFDRAYAQARRLAAKETGLPKATFAQRSPFELGQVLDENFMPEQNS